MSDEAVPAKKKKKKKAAKEPEKAPTPVASPKLTRGKSLVGWAAFLSLVGLGLIGTGEATIGPWITLGAAVLFVYGAHLIGRSGPDEGIFQALPKR